MADLVFNISKGRAVHYASLPAANDALILIPLETTGLETDATLRDYDDITALLAGTSNEQTTIGRKTLTTAVSITVDDVGDTVRIDMTDETYVNPTGNQVGAFVYAYDPDTTGGTDADLIPVTKHDVSWTPDGNDTDVRAASGVYTA